MGRRIRPNTSIKVPPRPPLLPNLSLTSACALTFSSESAMLH